MKIIIVGASGLIGSEVNKALSKKHDIIRVGGRSGNIICDYTNPESVHDMFQQVRNFDALISTVGGDSIFKHFTELSEDDFRYGFERKFLSQIRLLKIGGKYIQDGGSFTFTSGFLSDYPNPYSMATGPLNAAIDTFVKNNAGLLPRGIRLNIVSPAPIVEPGQEQQGTVTAAQTSELYAKAVEGNMTGKVLRAWGGLPYKPG